MYSNAENIRIEVKKCFEIEKELILSQKKLATYSINDELKLIKV